MSRGTNGPQLGHWRGAMCDRPAGLLSDEELEKVEQDINRFYNDGIPLYSRDNLAHIAKQIEDAKNGTTDKVSVDGLDGMPVEFEVNIGSKTESWGFEDVKKDHELFIKDVLIDYHSYDKINRVWSMEDQTCAYCSMRVMHVVGERSTLDGREHIAPGEPREKVEECFDTGRDMWTMSPECAELKRLISQATSTNRASKAIGLTLGSLTRGWHEDKLRHRTTVQHAMLMTIRDVLGEQSDVPCYIQDPAYTHTDIDILNEAGFTVLSDPNGLLEIDETSVVVSIAPDFPVKEVLVDLAKPAVIMWLLAFDPRLEDDGTPRLCTDPEGPRVKKFLAEFYDKVEFVGQKYYLGTLEVYIRRG